MRAELTLTFPTEKEALQSYRAIETESKRGERSNVNITLQGKTIHIVVEAKDFVALRTDVTALFRMLAVSMSV